MLWLQDHRRTPRSRKALDPHVGTIGGQGLSRPITGLAVLYRILPPHLVILAPSGCSSIHTIVHAVHAYSRHVNAVGCMHARLEDPNPAGPAQGVRCY